MTKGRSTNFPVVSLDQALDLTQKIWNHAQRHPVPATTVVEKLWGYSPSSSSGLQRLGAIRAFGLVEVTGSGSNRKVRVIDEAAKVLLDHEESPRLLKEFALTPRVHQVLWNELASEGMPPDDTIRHYLIFDYDPPFKEDAAQRLIAEFRRTCEYAELTGGGIPQEPTKASSAEEEFAYPEEEKSDDNTEKISQRPSKSAPEIGRRQDVFSADEGQIVVEWPSNLSTESIEDIKMWFDIIIRKMERASGSSNSDHEKGES
jgi:hypothetical protein